MTFQSLDKGNGNGGTQGQVEATDKVPFFHSLSKHFSILIFFNGKVQENGNGNRFTSFLRG